MTRKRKAAWVLVAVVALLALVLGAGFVYLTDYMPSQTSVQEFQSKSPEINLDETENGIFIDSPGSKDMLVFYPGAKVEPSAYIPLLYRLAEDGVDSYIVKMPFNMAVFNTDAFDEVRGTYPDYENWYIAGHSLGGAMAADYAANNPDNVDGLILLGAYSTKDLTNTGFPVLSIYGENDTVLNREKYDTDKANLPVNTTELVIEGGNHAGFGDYGPQKGDGEASVTKDEQQSQSAQEIAEFINGGDGEK